MKKKKFDKQRLWVKTVLNEKITNNILYDINGPFNKSKLLNYLMEICHSLDIPTPMVLKLHQERLQSFNIVRFSQNDFVESIDFDVLVLEHAVIE